MMSDDLSVGERRTVGGTEYRLVGFFAGTDFLKNMDLSVGDKGTVGGTQHGIVG